MKILAVSVVPPWFTTHGTGLRLAGFLRELSKVSEVVLVSLVAVDFPHGDPPSWVSEFVPVEIACSALNSSSAGIPLLLAAANRSLQKSKPDFLLLWVGSNHFPVEGAEGIPVIYDIVDCETYAQLVQLKTGKPSQVLAGLKSVIQSAIRERRVARTAIAVISAGTSDAKAMRFLGASKSYVIGNGVEASFRKWEMASGPIVAMSGNLNFPPNVDAAIWLCEEIWPLVERVLPNASLVLIGRNPSPEIRRLARDRIRVLADVANMQDELAKAWVTAAPMRVGSGVKNKTLESWAVGRPVVMTTHATNGLLIPDSHCELVQDTAHGFAHSITSLLLNPSKAESLGALAFQHVRDNYAWDKLSKQMQAVASDCLLRVRR